PERDRRAPVLGIVSQHTLAAVAGPGRALFREVERSAETPALGDEDGLVVLRHGDETGGGLHHGGGIAFREVGVEALVEGGVEDEGGFQGLVGERRGETEGGEEDGGEDGGEESGVHWVGWVAASCGKARPLRKPFWGRPCAGSGLAARLPRRRRVSSRHERLATNSSSRLPR